MSLGNVVIAFPPTQASAVEKHPLVCAVEARDVNKVVRLCRQSSSQDVLNAALLAVVRGYQKQWDTTGEQLFKKLLQKGADPNTCKHVCLPTKLKPLFAEFFRKWAEKNPRRRHA
jgi:hypothetical protein